jgi:hypothetical protein
MGLGALLIPGGNDTLLLIGFPMGAWQAALAYALLVASVAALIAKFGSMASTVQAGALQACRRRSSTIRPGRSRFCGATKSPFRLRPHSRKAEPARADKPRCSASWRNHLAIPCEHFAAVVGLEAVDHFEQRAAAKSGVNSLPTGTPPWNGAERPVSTVPGCRPTQIARGSRRASSRSAARSP